MKMAFNKRASTHGGSSSSSSTRPKKETTTPVHFFLDFSSQAHKEKHEILRKLPIIANRYNDYNELAVVGLKNKVKRLIEGIKWGYFIDIREATTRELLLEFFTTFQLYKNVPNLL